MKLLSTLNLNINNNSLENCSDEFEALAEGVKSLDKLKDFDINLCNDLSK